MASTSDYTVDKLFDVKGLKVLISGGHTGIGLMFTQALVANGAKVYIMGRRSDVLQESADTHSAGQPGSIHTIVGDVTSKESIQDVVKAYSEKEGDLDILINNSGVGGPEFDGSLKDPEAISKSLWSNDYSDAQKLFDINCLGYYFMSAAFIPLLAKSKNNPQIINVTSNAAFGRKAMVGILYSMTKAASTHMTKMLATHLSDTNIRVNAIAPGLFPSELTAGKTDSPDHKSSLKDTGGILTPVGRPGKDEEMATAVLFLASKRQCYATGSIILVDGGVLNLMPSTY